MTTAEAKVLVRRVWETNQNGSPAILGTPADLTALVERGLLKTWETVDHRYRYYMVTKEGKRFAGIRE